MKTNKFIFVLALSLCSSSLFCAQLDKAPTKENFKKLMSTFIQECLTEQIFAVSSNPYYLTAIEVADREKIHNKIVTCNGLCNTIEDSFSKISNFKPSGNKFLGDNLLEDKIKGTETLFLNVAQKLFAHYEKIIEHYNEHKSQFKMLEVTNFKKISKNKPLCPIKKLKQKKIALTLRRKTKIRAAIAQPKLSLTSRRKKNTLIPQFLCCT